MIQVLTTGGTFDKIYFDANSQFSVGESMVPALLSESNITEGYRIQELMRKDSLEITDADRATIVAAVQASGADRVLITHGTDTMAQTAEALKEEARSGRTIVLLGAMQPARMRRSDALFNLGFAWSAVQLLPAGVYIAMNGEVFEAGKVRKNLEAQRFEAIGE